MIDKKLKKVLLLLLVTVLLIGIVSATGVNKTSIDKKTNVIKQTQKSGTYSNKIKSTIKKQSSQKIIAKKNKNKTSNIYKTNKKSEIAYYTNASTFSELSDSINEAKESDYDSYTINLENRTYNSLNNLNWENSTGTRTLIINGNGATIDGNNSYRLFDISEGYSLKLKNITFNNFKANHQNSDKNGIIYNDGNLSLKNCIFNNNVNDIYSGETTRMPDYNEIGIIVNSGELNVSNSEFQNNSVEYKFGGGIINNLDNATCTVTKTLIKNNIGAYGTIYNFGKLKINKTKLINNKARYGGVIYNRRNNLNITNSILNNNMGDYYGGVICHRYNKLTINNCTFNNNKAEDGGAIYCYGKLNLKNSKFNNNSAIYGGAIYNHNNLVRITNSTFNKNTANEDGGAIYNYNFGKVKITNTTFNYNKAKTFAGGAIYNYIHSIMNIKNCKLNNNAAKYWGGAIYSTGNITITESTLNKNKAKSGGAISTNVHSQYEESKLKNYYGNITLTKSTLNNNKAENGGAIYTNSFIVIIEKNKFSKNAAVIGSAISSRSNNGYEKIKNNTFKRNKGDTTGNVIMCSSKKSIIKNNKNEKSSIFKDTLDIIGINTTITNNLFKDKENTKIKIKINNTKPRTNSYVKATISLKDSENNLLKNQKVKLKIGNKTFSLKTNNKGIAKKIFKTDKAKTIKITATYSGNKLYIKTTKSTTLKVIQKS